MVEPTTYQVWKHRAAPEWWVVRIEYDTLTHHSNQDVFDRVQADDMKQAATIMAAFVYQTAMMDEMMPRKVVR